MRKKLITAGAALLATAFIGQVASAKSLEDILKEKGVITEADYKEVTKVKPIDYKLGKGFTFTSQDEKFQLSLGGRMQFRYTFYDYDKPNTTASKNDYSLWDAKRIKLTMYGYAYTKDLTYGLQLDLRQGGSSKMLQDAFLNYKIIDEAQIKLGQYKVPFARQELISDGALQFVDRSIVVDNFKPTYDIGASLNGKIAGGIVNYDVGVFGGLGQTTGRLTNNNLFATRVVINPLGEMPASEPDLDISKKPLVSVGANYFRNSLARRNPTAATSPATWESAVSNYASTGWLSNSSTNGTASGGMGWLNTTNNQKVDVDSAGFDVAFKWMGFAAQAEYMFAQAENQAPFGAGHKYLRAHGYYAQAGYMILPQLEASVRYSYLDPNRDQANDTQTEQIGAISYYFNKHNLKLQADVGNTHKQSSATVKTDDMQYRLQAQITF